MQERHGRATYEEKLKRRQEREAAGKKMGGKPPKEPEAGPKDKEQMNFTHGSCRARKGTSYRAQRQAVVRTVTSWWRHKRDKQEMEPARTNWAPEVRGWFAHSKGTGARGTGHRAAGSREHPSAEDRAVPECPADADAVTAMQHVCRRPIYSKRPVPWDFGAFICAGCVHGVNLKRLPWQEDNWGSGSRWTTVAPERAPTVGGCLHHDPSRTTSIPPKLGSEASPVVY